LLQFSPYERFFFANTNKKSLLVADQALATSHIVKFLYGFLSGVYKKTTARLAVKSRCCFSQLDELFFYEGKKIFYPSHASINPPKIVYCPH